MGRRRRRVVRIVKKKLPTVFVCPRCGEEAVRVTIDKATGHAVVLCALCNLRDDFPAHPAAQPIDVYSYFTDRFYGVKEPRAIIPRDREFQQAPGEGAVGEEVATPEAPESLPAEEDAQRLTQVTEAKMGKASGTGPVTPEPLESTVEQEDLEEKTPTAEEPTVEAPAVAEPEEQKDSEEEAEPFADILENKDKKRYSANPLPQQTSEQTN